MPDTAQLPSLVNALGWMLVHFLWQGFAIAGAFWLACRCSASHGAQMRYAAGLGAFVLAALVPAVTFLVYLAPELTAAADADILLPAVGVAAGVAPTLSQWLSAALEPALPAVVMLWASGVAFLSSRTFLDWLGARSLVRLDAEPAGRALQEIAALLQRRLGVRRAVKLLRSTRVTVPTVIGWLKPVILLPAGVIARLPVDQLQMVIAHELGHIRRNDYLVNLLQLIIETLFFYHPAIRWLSRQVRHEREHCCDDLVVAKCGKRVLYARALANLEILREPPPVAAIPATGGDLLHRVRRIVAIEMPRNSSGFAQVALMMGMVAIVSVSAPRGVEPGGSALQNTGPRASAAEMSHGPVPGGREAWLKGVRQFATRSRTGAKPEVAPPGSEPKMSPANARISANAIPGKHAVSVEPEQQRSLVTTASGPVDGPALPLENSPHRTAPDRLLGQPGGDQDPSASGIRPAAGTSAPATASKAFLGPKSPPPVLAVTTVSPKYPFKARSKQLEGYVKLEFSVDAQGRVKDIEVVDAAPEQVFDRAALKALKKWKFDIGPGHTERLRLQQTFDFAMEESAIEAGPMARERRCDSTGSKICGMFYNRDHVEHYGSQKSREASSRRN